MSPMYILKRSFALSFYLNLAYYALGLLAYLVSIPGMAYIFIPHGIASMYLLDPVPGSNPFIKFTGMLLFAFALTTAAITVLAFLFIFLTREIKKRKADRIE